LHSSPSYTASIEQHSRPLRGRLSGIDVDPGALRRARLEAGLSLAQVAGSELSRQAVHLVETGKVRPSPRTLETIAARLGRPVTDFLPGGSAAWSASTPEAHSRDLERLCETHRYPEALDLALSRTGPEAVPRLRAVAHLYAGRALCQLARPAEAAEHLRRARELFESTGDPWGAAEALDWEGSAAYLEERIEPALALTEEALRRYRGLDPRRPDVEARMVEHVGTMQLRRGAPREALARYREALEVAGGLHELSRLGRVYHGLARCHWQLGDQDRAIELAQKAVNLGIVEHELSPPAARKNLPRIENDLGMMLLQCGQLRRAETMLESALSHLAEAGLERMRSHVLLSLSELRQQQGEREEAFRLAWEALDLALDRTETLAIASAYQRLGQLHAEQGEHDSVDRCFERAVHVLDEAGLGRRAAHCRAQHDTLRQARPAAMRHPKRLAASGG
jgi:tetratricopeptide (TPR) repeat protein/DNA-binding XRE family transcriptional regulator